MGYHRIPQKALAKIAKAGPVPALDKLPKVSSSQLRKAKDGDDKVFGALADQVAAIGNEIASSADGTGWGDIGVPKKAKGNVYLGE